jgi:hypothetical protein
MWQILRQIVRAGIVTEPPPALDAALKDEVRRIHDELLAILGGALAIRQVGWPPPRCMASSTHAQPLTQGKAWPWLVARVSDRTVALRATA